MSFVRFKSAASANGTGDVDPKVQRILIWKRFGGEKALKSADGNEKSGVT
jgi:hypothetical protein